MALAITALVLFCLGALVLTHQATKDPTPPRAKPDDTGADPDF